MNNNNSAREKEIINGLEQLSSVFEKHFNPNKPLSYAIQKTIRLLLETQLGIDDPQSYMMDLYHIHKKTCKDNWTFCSCMGCEILRMIRAFTEMAGYVVVPPEESETDVFRIKDFLNSRSDYIGSNRDVNIGVNIDTDDFTIQIHDIQKDRLKFRTKPTNSKGIYFNLNGEKYPDSRLIAIPIKIKPTKREFPSFKGIAEVKLEVKLENHVSWWNKLKKFVKEFFTEGLFGENEEIFGEISEKNEEISKNSTKSEELSPEIRRKLENLKRKIKEVQKMEHQLRNSKKGNMLK